MAGSEDRSDWEGEAWPQPEQTGLGLQPPFVELHERGQACIMYAGFDVHSPTDAHREHSLS